MADAQKYNIVASPNPALGLFMAARVNIKRGERILAEQQLDCLDVGLTSTYNAAAFCDPDEEYNATQDMQRQIESAQGAKRTALEALHKNENAAYSIFATNGFGYEVKVDGHMRTVIRVFNDISRINHSCRPNAVADWNSTLQMGTVHALAAIAANEEITICYLADEEDSLCDTRTRRDELQKHYHFMCQCQACQDGQDNAWRKKAGKKYQEIFVEGARQDETREMTRARKIKALTDEKNGYIKSLKQLKLNDSKLANAYKKLADLHEQGFHLALRRPGQHCRDCQRDRSPHNHLDSALKEWERMHRAYLLCCGVDHPVIAQNQQKVTDISRLLADYDE